jgi:DHA2 family multidrug resistance protein
VLPREQPSAAGLFAFLRTTGLAAAASLSLTYWDKQGRIAGSELAGKIHPEATGSALSAQGFSFEQSRTIIAQLVDKEAVTLATDKVFLVTGCMLIMIAFFVWFVPRPKHMVARGGH